MAECDYIEERVGGPENLADITGSKAYHVLSVQSCLRCRDSRDRKF